MNDNFPQSPFVDKQDVFVTGSYIGGVDFNEGEIIFFIKFFYCGNYFGKRFFALFKPAELKF